MMSFTLPHGVLCIFWWGSFPIALLATPSCTSHRNIRKLESILTPLITELITYNFRKYSGPNKQVNIYFEYFKTMTEEKPLYIFAAE
jgi:hypothetical protein